MGAPIEIDSVSQWNTTLRQARETNRPVIVDFHATWCSPCKVIAPTFAQLAAQYHRGVFLRVDVDKVQPIATKYQVSAMPTFYVISNGQQVDNLRGADPRGLAAMVAKHASVPALPAAAEKAKAEGNAAFSAGDYAKAVECYSRAIDEAPDSAVLRANRAYAYIKQIKDSATPKDERKQLRPRAIADAHKATTLDQSWAKGWVRMAEAMLLAGDEEGMEDVSADKRLEGVRHMLEGAQEALEDAVNLSDGKVKAEAQAMLADVTARLKAL
ncbi:thioredoxin-domain-containing protein [Schizophyllum amplum]|uniref:Thioredoxin n=1 Tax=Schizophyllum amplum TaxID=97359 RepID=A0A550BSI3_9AGAR|nr:thioredoxin-domain-containing protein [Auriculariopsis ampla]